MIPAPSKPSFEPEVGVPWQSASVKTSTLAVSALAVPLTSGLASVAGEAGSVAVIWGAAGAWVSTLNERVAVAELPAASVAVTRKL